MSGYVKGFVVGQSAPSFDAEGAMFSRPKLVEIEAFGKGVQIMIGAESVLLDADALEALISSLSSCEVVA